MNFHIHHLQCLGAATLGVVLLTSSPAVARPVRAAAASVTVRVTPPEVQEALRDEVKLEPRSSGFEVSADRASRNPLWPVGWKPGMKTVEKTPTTRIDPNAIFSISSIMLGPPDLVVINGKRYETGDDVPVAMDNKTLNFKIVQIRDGDIIMQFGAQKFPVSRRGRNPESGGTAAPASTPAPAPAAATGR